jgi:peroxiredoxin/mono/diheme cytochrome c family protein
MPALPFRSRFIFWTMGVLVSVTLLGLPASADSQGGTGLPAKPIADFALEDYRGKTHRLQDFSKFPIVVVAFLGTECPLAKFYALRLEELKKTWGEQDVALIAIDTNAQDSLAEIAAFARRQGLTYPILKDEAHRVAEHFGATRTPEVFVLDSARMVRYFGRIDDQYGIGYQKKTVGKTWLKDAVEALRSDSPMVHVSVPAVGCLVGRSPQPQAAAEVTYSEHIAKILQERCIECHRDGEIGPMALTAYEEASGWAAMIEEVVTEGRMPPWHASPEFGSFANDRSLSDEEKSLIKAWVAAGAPQGDPAKIPPAPQFTEGWQLSEKPDAVFAMRDKPFDVPATGEVNYKYFVVDLGFDEDKWLRSAEIQPSNRAVVHHVLVFARPRGSRRRMGGERGFLAGYVPGSRVRPYPDGMAKRIPANSELVFQVHYTPIGTPQSDLTKIGLDFVDAANVTHEVITTSAFQENLQIPPGEGDYRTSAMLPEKLPKCQLLVMTPHMHLRGKSFRYQVVDPLGERKTILDVPRYDFNWQTAYFLDRPLDIDEGSRIFCEASFDNSDENLNNPAPQKTVYWGDQTYDEMMIGYFDIVVPVTQNGG